MQELEKYDGFENAVTAIALGEKNYIATSSGMQMDNMVTGYSVRMFKDGKCISRSSPHYGSIRCSSICTPGRNMQMMNL